MTPITKEWLESKVIIDANGCWIWQGATSNGYAQVWTDGSSQRCYRVSYICYKGPVKPGLYVLHKCDVKRCINPEHLYEGTAQQNRADLFARGDPEKVYNQNSYNKSLTKCKRGHPLSGDNVYLNPSSGSRQCKACLKERRANK